MTVCCIFGSCLIPFLDFYNRLESGNIASKASSTYKVVDVDGKFTGRGIIGTGGNAFCIDFTIRRMNYIDESLR